jgi:hypothetical protein
METISPKQYAEDLVKSLLNKVPHGNLYSDLHYAKEEAMKQLVKQIQENNISIAFVNETMAEVTKIKNL